MAKRVTAAIVAVWMLLAFTGCGHEHQMAERTIREVSCTEDGEIEHYCVSCDYRYPESVWSTGHEYGEPVVVTQALCNLDGLQKSTCKKCGDVKEEVLPAAHAYEKTVIREATCTVAGRERLVCSLCGHTEEAEVKRQGHLFVANECTRCDAVKLTDLNAYTWYYYKELDFVWCQNAAITNAFSTRNGRAASVTYYPICDTCRVTGPIGVAGPELDYPVAKMYYCNNCDSVTTVKFKIEY